MNWHIGNAQIPGRDRPVDLFVTEGVFRVLSAGTAPLPDSRYWNVEGRVVLPGLVELHTHIDKTYSDPRNPEGTLRGAIECFEKITTERTLLDIEARAERALRTAIAHGVTRLRTHLVFGRSQDLAVLEVMTGLRQRYSACIDLQYVAMTWDVEQPERQALLEAGVRAGIDLIGGAPSLGTDPAGAVLVLLEVAERLGVGLDLHVDEHDDATGPALKTLIAQIDQYRIPGCVAASHCCSLGFVPAVERDELLHRAAARNIALIALPACNLVLMGRNQWPVPRGMAPIAAARQAGMLVGVGADNVQDPFNPFGDYDPLQSARLAALVGHLPMDDHFAGVLDLVTTAAASIFGGAPARIDDGLPADFVITDCRDRAEIIAHPPLRLATFKRGERVFNTRLEQTWSIP